VTLPGVRVPAAGTSPAAGADAAEDLRLARLHLRLGMLTVAQSELEDLDGRGALDVDGRASLAEARWRGGDLDGAADAAVAHLAEGGRDAVALVIAAEAMAADGQAGEARSLMQRLGGLDGAALDAIFAGIPRRAHWPAVGVAAGGAPGSEPSAGETPTDDAVILGSATPGMPAVRASAVPGPAEVLELNAGLWDERPGAPAQPLTGTTGAAVDAAVDAAASPGVGAAESQGHGATWVEPARVRGHADPEAELDAARDELSSAPDRGLLRLALVLRLDPTLAPDVLEAVRLRREPAAVVIRGDAERLLGRHLEAEAAFADAIESIEREALADRAALSRRDRASQARAAGPAASRHDVEPDRQEDS